MYKLFISPMKCLYLKPPMYEQENENHFYIETPLRL